MKTIYLDCGMGAAGDMLTAALYELLNDEEKLVFINKMNNLGLEKIKVEAETAMKCGITGTHMKVTVDGEEEESHDHHEENHHDHEHEEHHHHHHEDHEHHENHEEEHHHAEEHSHHHHHHSSMADIEHLISHLLVSDKVKKDVAAVYKLIAEAESHAHNKPITDIHFHEVGTMDALADVTAVCLLVETLGAERIIASPVHVGSGHVHCAHGILPVPAPATAFILKDIPMYSGKIHGELCTPTGAALLKYFVTDFGEMPAITVNKIGYGMGKKDFEMANCVRAMLGETSSKKDTIVEFTCNLDDISAERIGFAMEQLLAAGAVEVYTIPVVMKKSRPGNLLCVMCKECDKEKIINTIFKHTTTIGIRENISNRYCLNRKIETISTEFGDIRVKCSEGYGVSRKKLEYEDLAEISRKTGLAIEEIASKINL